MSISETCSCGAAFGIETVNSVEAQKAVKEWRKNHQHAFPPAKTMYTYDTPAPQPQMPFNPGGTMTTSTALDPYAANPEG